MNRDNKGKALHYYLSTSQLIFAMRNGATQQNWGSLTEEIQEEYRKVGEGLAQDLIYGGKYELSSRLLMKGKFCTMAFFPMYPQFRILRMTGATYCS